MTKRRLIGILGGMGPLATVDFMQKLIATTPATRDQDHVPVIVYSVPQIPDRVSAIAAGTDEPFPAILAGLRTLERAGAEIIAMPCNTAHAWYDRLAASTDIEILHMADAVSRRIGSSSKSIALLATSGTVRAGFYQRNLSTSERTVIVPSSEIQAGLGLAIAAVKANDLEKARGHFQGAAQALLDVGAVRLLLACTELPMAAQGSKFEDRCLDATACLAEACVAASLGKASAARVKEAGSWTSVGSKIS